MNFLRIVISIILFLFVSKKRDNLISLLSCLVLFIVALIIQQAFKINDYGVLKLMFIYQVIISLYAIFINRGIKKNWEYHKKKFKSENDLFVILMSNLNKELIIITATIVFLQDLKGYFHLKLFFWDKLFDKFGSFSYEQREYMIGLSFIFFISILYEGYVFDKDKERKYKPIYEIILSKITSNTPKKRNSIRESCGFIKLTILDFTKYILKLIIYKDLKNKRSYIHIIFILLIMGYFIYSILYMYLNKIITFF